MVVLVTLAVALWAFTSISLFIGTALVIRHYDRRTPEPPNGQWPPVSVLKPLKGVDSDLEANLATFFALDYPRYEILFSVADASDAACEVAARLIKAHPEVPATLYFGEMLIGPNPKVNNLLRPITKASHDLILISDSNVRANPTYLKRLVSEMRDGVGVVTAATAGRGAVGLAGDLETAYQNTFFVRWMHLASAVGVPLVMGKSMLFRRRVAHRFGGLLALSPFIAEDFWMGRNMKALGLRVALMREPIHHHIGAYTFKNFWDRHVRWGRIRKGQAPFAFLIEPAGTAWISGLIGAWAFHQWLGVSALTFFAVHTAYFLAADLWLLKKMGGDRPLWRAMSASILREALALPLWAYTLAGSTVRWRGNRLLLHFGGRVSQISEPRNTPAAELGQVRPHIQRPNL